MAEFSLIERFCQNIGASHSSTTIGIGDDAAVLHVPADRELVVSVDTLVEGVHFFSELTPERLAYKLAAVNLSDMAAMGAEPKWATLALTLPRIDTAWLGAFSQALDRICRRFDVQLVGGDTTQGFLTLSMQIMGLVERGTALTRAGARLGESVYVSGVMGDAALALASIQGRAAISDGGLELIRPALDRPIPQIELGRSLSGLASACIDVSDGLVADLGHIASMSQVSINIELEKLPLSQTYRNYLQDKGSWDYALSGGDDYQLAFTVAADKQKAVQQLANKLEIPLTKIGITTTRAKQPVSLTHNGKPYQIRHGGGGYQHFSDATDT